MKTITTLLTFLFFSFATYAETQCAKDLARLKKDNKDIKSRVEVATKALQEGLDLINMGRPQAAKSLIFENILEFEDIIDKAGAIKLEVIRNQNGCSAEIPFMNIELHKASTTRKELEETLDVLEKVKAKYY